MAARASRSEWQSVAFKTECAPQKFFKSAIEYLEAAKSAFIDDSIAFCSARRCDLMKSERDLRALNMVLERCESDFDAMAMRSRSASIETEIAMSVCLVRS